MTLLAVRRASPVLPRVRSGLPLTPNEERYVLSEATASEVYGNPWTLRIRGPLDVKRLERAVVATCQRHEARRSGFEPSPAGGFSKYVEAQARPEFTHLSLSGASDEAIAAAVRAWFDVECDLTPPAMNRFLFLRLAQDDYIFGCYFHHAVNDGTSHHLAVTEMFERYRGKEDYPPAVAYSDLFEPACDASAAHEAAGRFWAERLAGLTDVAGLPDDGGEPWSGPAFHRLDPAVAARARAAATAAGVSEFTFYYAVLLVLLARMTGDPRVCSTFQSDGRRKIPGADEALGVFSNTLVLAAEVDPAASIAAFAGRLRSDIREALHNDAFPYHHVIRATGVRPRFAINWFPEIPPFTAPGLEITGPEMSYGRWEYDLNFRFVRRASGAMDLVLYFAEELICRRRAEAATRQFEALLGAFAERLDAPVAEVRSADIAPAGLLPDPSEPLAAAEGELIHLAFLRRAQEAPDAPALLHGETTYSYADVERRSRAVAAQLRAQGVRRGQRVAILAARSPQLVWTMLGASRAGAAFVVLDSAYPDARLEALIDICRPHALTVAGPAELADRAGKLRRGRRIKLVDGELQRDAPEPGDLDAGSPDELAYLLFTSGSTGLPKAVACSHRPLSHFVAWQAETYQLGASDRFTLLSGLAHDPLLRDIFTPLSIGAALAIPEAAVIGEPRALASWMRAAGATVAHLTPPLGQVLLAGATRMRGLPDLRRLFWGGDQLPAKLVQDMAAVAPHAIQTNFYGATETPQAAAAGPAPGEPAGQFVAVGRGAEGFQLLVVDTDRRLLGIGEIGEIAVRSTYLSLGYVQAGRLSPLLDEGSDVYFTGDRGLFLPDGAVLMLGRADDQVKVHGYRVHLSEVRRRSWRIRGSTRPSRWLSATARR